MIHFSPPRNLFNVITLKVIDKSIIYFTNLTYQLVLLGIFGAETSMNPDKTPLSSDISEIGEPIPQYHQHTILNPKIKEELRSCKICKTDR